MAHSGEMFVDWYRDVAAIRALYKERNYRPCAALCDKLLPTTSHPVYRLFLYFYQSVCYESLGDAVQANSRSKNVLWEQARTALVAAGEMCDDAKAVMGLESGMTPGYVKLAVLDEYCFDSPSSYAASSPEGLFGLAVNIADQNVRGQIFGCDRMLRLQKNSPGSQFKTPVRQDYQRQTHDLSLASTKGPSKIRSVHKVRLSQSLSLDHQLADHLVPSPLFSRHSSTISQAVSSVLPSSPTPSQSLAVHKPLPPIPQDRPLPTLPLQAQPHFITTGDKIVLRPRRTTALATLIAKYEAREKVYTTPRNLDVYKISSEDGDGDEEEERRGRQRTRLEGNGFSSDEILATPLTQRYNRISDIFVPKPSSCEKSDTMFEVYTDRFDERLVGDVERESALHDGDHDTMAEELRAQSGLLHDISDKENWTVTEYTDLVSATTPRPVSVPPLRLPLTLTPTPTATAIAHYPMHQTPTQPRYIDRTYNHLPIPPASPATTTPKYHPTAPPSQLPAHLTALTALTALLSRSLHALATQISALESATTVSKPQPQLFCNDSSKRKNDKAARISELKVRGWKGINAKSKGFKGREYFDWFVGEVERELEVDARG